MPRIALLRKAYPSKGEYKDKTAPPYVKSRLHVGIYGNNRQKPQTVWFQTKVFLFQKGVKIHMSRSGIFLMVCGIMVMGALMFVGGFIAAFTTFDDGVMTLGHRSSHQKEVNTQERNRRRQRAITNFAESQARYHGHNFATIPQKAGAFSYYANHVDDPGVVAPYITSKARLHFH